MGNQLTENVRMSDIRAGCASREGTERAEAREAPIEALRIPVGTNLANVERWLIFATLQKCGGNKTRAAALLGVSLKTLYNRLNAYRAQGLAMDYDAGPTGEQAADHAAALDGLDSLEDVGGRLEPGELNEVPL